MTINPSVAVYRILKNGEEARKAISAVVGDKQIVLDDRDLWRLSKHIVTEVDLCKKMRTSVRSLIEGVAGCIMSISAGIIAFDAHQNGMMGGWIYIMCIASTIFFLARLYNDFVE